MSTDHLRRAALLLRQNRKKEARLLARIVLQEEPTNADAWAVLAQAAEGRDEAVECLQRVRNLTRSARTRAWAEERLAQLGVRGGALQLHPSPPGGGVLRGAAAGLGAAILVLVGVTALMGTSRPAPPDGATETGTPTVSLHPARMTLTAWALTPRPTATHTPWPTDTPTPRPTITWAPTRTPLPPATDRPPATPALPDGVTLISPAAGAIVNQASTTFEWSADGAATGYRLVVRRLDGSAAIDQHYGPEVCSGARCGVTVPGSMLGNGTYSWQVEAGNGQSTAASDSLTFTRAWAELSGFALGGQVPNSFSHAGLMKQAGMTWIKLQVIWPEIPASTAGAFVRGGHGLGFRVLLSVKGPVYQTSIDFAGYLDYLHEVASYQPDAIEVWNEMNLSTEWPAGQIDPRSYVNDMLGPAYRTIKQTSPDTVVITGALASTGVHDGVNVWSDDLYLRGMMRAGAARYADCIGFHYNAGATSPRATSGHPADPGTGHYSWYFKPTVDVYRNGSGGRLPLCLTEVGFLSGEGYPPLPQDWFWAGGTTAELQAAWLAETVQYARELGFIRLVVIWNVDFTTWGENGDPQAGFAIVRPDGSCPACEALRAVMEQQP